MKCAVGMYVDLQDFGTLTGFWYSSLKALGSYYTHMIIVGSHFGSLLPTFSHSRGPGDRNSLFGECCSCGAPKP